MNYVEVIFQFDPAQVAGDILLAEVSELPFESFVEEEGSLQAYITSEDFDETALKRLEVLQENSIDFTWKEIEQVNWNAEWEKNFPIVEIGNDCVVKADFHQLEKDYRYEIKINPKMSFGTGHHATTSLVLEYMLGIDFQDKAVLDMGSGTGVLAILAAMKGASGILAIDNDEWAFENSKENVALNGFENRIDLVLGDVNAIDRKFDVVLANINKNVIVAQLEQYAESLNSLGQILLSGILIEDMATIKSLAQDLGLNFVFQKEKDKWALLVFSK